MTTVPQMELESALVASYHPIIELMRAIIVRTVKDYHSGGRLKAEALEFMRSTDEEYIFSFRSVCRQLGFNHEYVRMGIINSKETIKTRRRAA